MSKTTEAGRIPLADTLATRGAIQQAVTAMNGAPRS